MGEAGGVVTDNVNRDDEVRDMWNEENPDGAELLDRIVTWLSRFIAVTDPDDLKIAALWIVHTYLAVECYTTPRLQIDSVVFESGKTTLLDHLSHLCLDPVQAASLSSPALIPRLLENRMRTILLDEVDRSLHPDRPGVGEMLGIINSGYRVGATRPVLVPVKGGGWDSAEMPVYAPVAMAGNSPSLPADTVSRCIRILLWPDVNGTVEDSDWEHIGDDAKRLGLSIAAWTDNVRAQVKGMKVELPKGCISRSREKWRPLKRIAVAAGGDWPNIVDRLVTRSLAEDAAMREAGLKAQPPGMVLLRDLYAVWPEGEHANLMSAEGLVGLLVNHNPAYWGEQSSYGKRLTEQRMGRLLSQACKVTSSRPGGGNNPRGYLRVDLEPVWRSLRIPEDTTPPREPDEPDKPDTPDEHDTADMSDKSGLSDTKGDPPPGQWHPDPPCFHCDQPVTGRHQDQLGRYTHLSCESKS